ncbi:hypothetical protein [Terribacillus sp. DMT04]|uniref:hypothetical protein n=1 Tax=Terribacillus sp. DMT04 TaxID=2850441 RepID=UPI001C2CAB4E|nr:hypothetical protein [Terribacillus sp. DMT04]QXE02701.1 hypothetical protein KS242_05825 [Terribacillus sp. DMT04]
MFVRILLIGSAAGLVLSGWMFLWQQLTGIRVYTLLMNVDFIPILKQVEWSQLMLNLFHLIISWAIVPVYILMKRKLTVNNWLIGLVMSAAVACIYFPLVILAVKSVPSLWDGYALLIWYTGHLLYGIFLVKLTDIIKM